MKRNIIVMEDCPSKPKVCRTCANPIIIREIRVTTSVFRNSSFYYHLHCFSPRLKQYICLDDIYYKLNEQNFEVAIKWIQDWNNNYIPLDFPIFVREIPKMVESKTSKMKRSLLEIFKFLDPIEILTSIAYVNKEYYNATWEPELWKHFLIKDFSDSEESSNYRAHYIQHYTNRCIECKELPSEKNYLRCPLLEKVICMKCKTKSKFKLISKTYIDKNYDIDPNKLDLKFGYSNGNKRVTYFFRLEKALFNFRAKNKVKIVNILKKTFSEDHEILGIVEKISVDSMDKPIVGYQKIESNYDMKYEFLECYKMIFDQIRKGKRSAKLSDIIKKVKEELYTS